MAYDDYQAADAMAGIGAQEYGATDYDAADAMAGIGAQEYGTDGSQDFDIGAIVMSATAAIAPDYQATDAMAGIGAREYGMAGAPVGGVAPTLGSNWITETLGGAAKWYEKQDKETKGTLLSLAGSFIKGAFSHKNEERKLKSSEKLADAAMLNAQTNADMTNKKFANASSIGGTNFGAPTGLMTYSDKLAPRRARNQYKV